MKVVIQRSKNSSVSVDNKIVNKIEHGLVILVGITDNDTDEDIDYLVLSTKRNVLINEETLSIFKEEE